MADRRGPVLIVEDDESLRLIVARHLRARATRSRRPRPPRTRSKRSTAGSGPAVVLLDLNLPGDTGWDLLRGPALAAAGSPPVVITSATTVSPKRLAEFRVRRLPAQAIPARDPRRDDRAA